MLEKVFFAFLGLVALYVILIGPDRVVDLVQLFIDGAFKLAKALLQLNLHENAAK
jgi:hypothetical protein